MHATVNFEKHVYYAGPKFLNLLPANIKLITNGNSKLKEIKRYLKEKNFYDVRDFCSL